MKTLDELLDEGKSFREINKIMQNNYQAGWYDRNGNFINMNTLVELGCVSCQKEYINRKEVLTFSDGRQMNRIDYGGGGFVVPTCEYIFESVFKESKIEEIILPDGIKEIGADAFLDSDLCKIFIPKSIEDLGYNSFFSTPYNLKVFYEGSEEDFWKLKEITESKISEKNINFNSSLIDIKFNFIKKIEKNVER